MKRNRGLSLIEAIISTFITTLSVLSIAALKSSQASVSQSQLQFYNAWQLLDYKLTDLRRLVNNENNFISLNDDVGGEIASGENQQAQFIYKLNWQVNEITDGTMALSVRKVTVTVSWQSRDDDKLMISDSTLLSVLVNENNRRGAL